MQSLTLGLKRNKQLCLVPGWERAGLEGDHHLGVTGSPATQQVTTILRGTRTRAVHSLCPRKSSLVGVLPSSQGLRQVWSLKVNPAGEASSPVLGQMVGGTGDISCGEEEEGSRLPSPEGQSCVCQGQSCVCQGQPCPQTPGFLV